jgi:hypothetical protein
LKRTCIVVFFHVTLLVATTFSAIAAEPEPGSLTHYDGDAHALIKRVSRKYGVPAGALYGIWSVESAKLLGGWGTPAHGWYLAADLVGPDGLCTKKYGQSKCLYQWRSLLSICAQKRRNGSAVCDPYKVRTSYALAMGPMQHMPAGIVEYRNGSAAWSFRAANEHRDGVLDPHCLADAMAMAAVLLRSDFERDPEGKRSWQRAINRYLGSQDAGYMEGTTGGKKGVVSYWREWCERHGCKNTFASS